MSILEGRVQAQNEMAEGKKFAYRPWIIFLLVGVALILLASGLIASRWPSYILLGLAGVVLGIHGFLTNGWECLAGLAIAAIVLGVGMYIELPTPAMPTFAFLIGAYVPTWAHSQAGD